MNFPSSNSHVIKKCNDCGTTFNMNFKYGRATKCSYCGSANISKASVTFDVTKKEWFVLFGILIAVGLILVFEKEEEPDTNDAQIETGESWAYAEIKAKTEAQIEEEIKAFAETKAKAEAGDAEMQTNLGAMYYRGKGVGKNFKEAVKWYQKAADQGVAVAQKALGWMYGMGKGVEQNYVTAYAWTSIAATNGNNIPPRFKSEFLEPKMTLAQITKAEELVKEMVKKNPKLLNKE